MSKAYVIAGGGSGAKVVEALTFLCAAGVGPEELNILLVDCDAQNGNLKRTRATIDAYKKMCARPWKWSENKPQPFCTKIELFVLDAQIANTRQGLRQHVAVVDDALGPALSVLFDESELSNPFEVGFKGRPNIGSLVLANHLRRHFLQAGSDAHRFLDRLMSDAGLAVTGKYRIPLMVVGSIFGGTGASLKPVVYNSVQTAFNANAVTAPNFQALSWSRCLLLPYFRPRNLVDNVNPDIFLFNASVALKHYARSPFTGVTYLVGSSNLERNTVDQHVGASEQCNPGYFEEVLAAVAALRFVGEVKQNPALPPLLYVPSLEIKQDQQRALFLDDLPLDGKELDAFAYLLHMGAFYLRDGEGEGAPHDYGLHSYLNLFRKGLDGRTNASFSHVPWFVDHVYPWSKYLDLPDLPKGASAAQCADRLLGGNANPYAGTMNATMLEFFGRLLLWATGVFDKENVSAGIELSPAKTCFRSVHSTMCMKDDEIKNSAKVAEPSKDNVLVRSCRLALAAMKLEGENDKHGRRRGFEPFMLWPNKDSLRHVLVLALDEGQIRKTMTDAFPEAEVKTIATCYHA